LHRASHLWQVGFGDSLSPAYRYFAVPIVGGALPAIASSLRSLESAIAICPPRWLHCSISASRPVGDGSLALGRSIDAFEARFCKVVSSGYSVRILISPSTELDRLKKRLTARAQRDQSYVTLAYALTFIDAPSITKALFEASAIMQESSDVLIVNRIQFRESIPNIPFRFRILDECWLRRVSGMPPADS